MKIIFRSDASTSIGTGHIMRCLTLAQLLVNKGAKVIFICVNTSGNMNEFIQKQGFTTYSIPHYSNSIEDAKATCEILQKEKGNLLIVDHYQIDIQWEKEIRKIPIKIMVIDDLANRHHSCDILLDQNYLHNYETRYDTLVPEHCRKLLGPKYLLLRPEFYQTKNNNVSTSTHILVFYGGSDPTNETMKALNALDSIDTTKLNIHVVVGVSNPNKDEIERRCQEKNYYFYKQIDYLAQLMSNCTFSLGAGGVTMWERMFLGLPSIVTVVADNQRETTEAAADYGAIWNVGWHEDVNVSNLVDIISKALSRPEQLQQMSKKGKQLMQAERDFAIHPVVETIMEVLNK